MKILAIDTSGPVCGAAVLAEGRVAAEQTVWNQRTHSVNLLPMVDEVLRGAGLTLAELDRLAVTVGPGSFTGVRIGVSTMKGLAHGCGKPIAAVNALEALAAGASLWGDVICPIQDARAGQVYGAAFRGGERLLPDAPLKLEDYVAQVLPLGERFLFVGDGMPVHRARLAELLGERAVFAPPHAAYLRPGAVAALAERVPEEALQDYRSLMPLYLRAPSAERNRKLVEVSHG